MKNIRFAVLALAASLTLALSGCLQDEKDPAAANDVGKLTGSFYAAGLANITVQIQNAVMGNASWFTALSNSYELNLASLGIQPGAMGGTVKSFVCPIPGGTSVYQITWLDGRNAQGQFSVKGIGTDAGSIVQSLRARVAADQVGIYNAGSAVELANGQPFNIPSSCSGLSIPAGTPVIAFKIDRPAPPSENLARTEYKTDSCGVDAQGLARRGTKVLKRTVQFLKDGTIQEGNWETESMGNCVDDVLVTLSNTAKTTGGGTANLANFAAIALRDLLQEQLATDCISKTITSNKRNAKTIDTCGRVTSQGNKVVTENNANDASDTRTLDCKGATSLNLVRFTNLTSDQLGFSTTTWTTGTATIVRTLDNKTVNTATNQQANRYKWLGTDISCAGTETFFVACNKIPGQPALQSRVSGNKWVNYPVIGYFVSESWFATAFNLCWIGSCTQVTGGTITDLNPNYFTGTYSVYNSGATANRNMQATSWLDNETFRPNATPSTAWRLPDSSNYCVWSQRVMIAACPFTVDSSRQGSWSPAYSYLNTVPVALDPGISGGDSAAGRIYDMARAQGRLTGQVVLNWEECNFKGCNYWNEYAGPGFGTYIKQWYGTPVTPGAVILSGAAKDIRTNMCTDISFQLNSSALVPQAQAAVTQKNSDLQARETELTAATNARNAAQTNLDSANGEIPVRQAAVTAAQNTVTTRTSQRDAAQTAADAATSAVNDAQTLVTTRESEQQQAQDDYDADPSPANQSALNTANANLASAQNDLTTAQGNETAANNDLTTAGTNLTTAQGNLTAAQTALTSAQAAATTAQNNKNTAQTAYDQAVIARNNAETERDTAVAQLAAAQSAASSGLGRDLTADERTALQSAYTNLCSSQNDTLNTAEQQATRSTCTQNYNTPANFAALPSVNNYCNAVFDRSGTTLTFKQSAPTNGSNVYTTLLNTEGVMLAHKATVVNNNTLAVTQRDFIEPLQCLRQEERYFAWPRVYWYMVCGGKGGCWWVQALEYVTITESTTRQWSGYSYTDGTWSLPSHGYRSAYGHWTNLSDIPNPLY